MAPQGVAGRGTTWASDKPAASRRQFIATTASAVAAATILPRHVLGGAGFVPPSDKVNVAIIGVGGQGLHNARALFQEKDCQIIAIADPAEEWDMSRSYHGGMAGRGPTRAEIEETYAERTPLYGCAVYEDFRVMLEEQKAIDAVLIATPDHHHAYESIWAMKAGKHVYCEKPLTHSVDEARIVARVARETGVATQMGNQGRSGEGHRQTVEWIQDGAIGAVQGGARLERHGSPLEASPAGRGRPGAGGAELGPLDRPPGAASLPSRVHPGELAGLLGLRRAGRMPDMSVHHIDPAYNALACGRRRRSRRRRRSSTRRGARGECSSPTASRR